MVEWMDHHWYPSFAANWDDELLRSEILRVMKPHHHVLDIGAGAGIVGQMNFKGVAARICGVDLDERVLENPYLDEGRVGKAETLPYPDATFDVAFADNVLEHLDDPLRVFREIARVLRPGGYFLAKTPNRWHYMPIAASATPHWFHAWYNGLRGRHESDTFPTRYKANSVARVRDLAHHAGFEDEFVATYEGRPEYLRLAAPAYAIGCLYERLVNRFDVLKNARILLVAKLRKR
jgi:SAM-dependent methyltransferase